MNDPYDEIKKSVSHAVNWQIKENVFINGREVETDMPRLMRIIMDSSYKGYVPIETLGDGDAKEKVRGLFNKLTQAITA